MTPNRAHEVALLEGEENAQGRQLGVHGLIPAPCMGGFHGKDPCKGKDHTDECSSHGME